MSDQLQEGESTPGLSGNRREWLAQAEQLDRKDPLAPFRQRFELPPGRIYLDGNSLGALPRGAAALALRTVQEEWGEGQVASWNTAGWYELPLTLGDRLGELVGAGPGQVAVCDSTTVNLFKALGAALGMRPERRAVLVDGGDFPTNLYISEGAMHLAPSGIERHELGVGEDPVDRITALGERLAVVAMSHVNYRTGRAHDLARVSAAARSVGALVIWDLCHSAGVRRIELDEHQVDFAVGCTYKYLNGGPGAPAWIYVARRHLGVARQPLSGWMGHSAPFEFRPDYEQNPGIRGFLCGTPPIVSMRGVQAGLDTFEGVDLAVVQRKAEALGEIFRQAVESEASGLALACPADPALRGAQVCFRHPHGYALVQAMIERGVVGDFRAPDVLRFGFAPLYVSHRDAVAAAAVLVDCLREQVWHEERFARPTGQVT